MDMIDAFKDTLQSGMIISKCKELSNKYKITLEYNGMQGSCELNKLCSPGNEKSLCMQAINTAISSMYIDNENIQEAKAWLHGERWDNIKTVNDNTPNMRDKVKEYINELDSEIQRCIDWVEQNMNSEACKVAAMECRIQTLEEVKNDLKSRLEEVI